MAGGAGRRLSRESGAQVWMRVVNEKRGQGLIRFHDRVLQASREQEIECKSGEQIAEGAIAVVERDECASHADTRDLGRRFTPPACSPLSNGAGTMRSPLNETPP
jgi:hypothetical protein